MIPDIHIEKDDKVKDLKDFYKKNYDERLKEIKRLNYIKSCNESTIESLENTNESLKKRINKLESYNAQLEYEVKIVRDAHDMCEHKYQDLKAKKVDLVYANYKLKVENEKLKLDCEKLQHGYNDMIFCGGRQNGKQYAALVELFKKIDQKKVDEAYKEVYNTTLPLWQKEFFKQMCDIHKESKEKIKLPRTLDINGTTYRKSIQIKDFGEQITKLAEESSTKPAFTIDHGYMITGWDPEKDFAEQIEKIIFKLEHPTKREEMWENILGASKCPPVEVKVSKQDITSFLRELQDKIPEARWNGSDCPPVELSVPNWFKHDYIYFALFRNDDKGSLRICYDDKPHSWINKPVIEYIAPMRWDLFKKGRLAVKVNYDNYKEFYEACEKELGKKPMTVYTGEYTVSICKKDGLFQVFTVGHQKTTGKKIVDWEDVR